MFVISHCSLAQYDFNLVDSLIRENQFPIAYPTHTNVVARNDFESLKEDYKIIYILEENVKTTRFNYLIKKRVGFDSTYFSGDSNIWNNNYDTKYTNAIALPQVYLAYFYPETYRLKGKWYYSFSIDHYIKNWGDSNWTTNDYVVDIKIYDVELKIFREGRFGNGKPSNYPGPEGWIGTSFNHLNYYTKFNPKPKVYPWSPSAPNIYTYTIEVLDKNLKPYQTFIDKLGFRYIEEHGKTIRINDKKILFKANKVNSTLQLIEKEYLYNLKRHNFNTIILGAKADERVFDLCDSLGLFVVQEINTASFASLSDLLNYFMMVKDHPSFVIWQDKGFDSTSVKILKRLDYSRPFFEAKHDIQFRVIANWDSLDYDAREKIKNQFQNFKFNFSANTSTLEIQLEEPFEFMDKIVLRWIVRKGGLDIEFGVIEQLEVSTKNMAELFIPFKKLYSVEERVEYEFELEIKEDVGYYRKGDIIAFSKFQLINNDPKPVLEKVY